MGNIFKYIFISFDQVLFIEANRCAAHGQCVAVKSTGCKFDAHSRKLNIYLNIYFHFFALVSRKSAAFSSGI